MTIKPGTTWNYDMDAAPIGVGLYVTCSIKGKLEVFEDAMRLDTGCWTFEDWLRWDMDAAPHAWMLAPIYPEPAPLQEAHATEVRE